MRMELRVSWAKLLMVAVFAGAIIAPLSIASAQQQQDSQVKLDLDLKDADMMAATNVLFAKTGVQFVVEPSSRPYDKVTLKLSSVTADEAVRYICQAAG